VLAALTSALLASTATPATPCEAALPQGPAAPAPIVFRTSCGGFRLNTSGRVSRLPPRWFAAHSGGTGRRFGADLQIRRNRAGRIFLMRQGRLVWRSHDLYPRTGGDVAFGPNTFAFASYYRGIFVTDLNSPERLVYRGRGRYPYDFFRSGRLIVTGGRAITVLSPEGRVERRYPYSRRGGFSFDCDTNTLFYVTPRDRLATVTETHLRVGRRLGFDGMVSYAEPGRLVFYDRRSVALADRTGRLIARAHWQRGGLDILDSGAAVSPDGRHLAFRLSDARAGARSGNAVLFLVAAGERRARAIYRHRLGPIGCGTAASLRWHGQHLLYSSADGQVAIIDAAGRRHDLAQFATALPRRGRTEQPLVAWRADYPSG
jgi:hypothetical protein